MSPRPTVEHPGLAPESLGLRIIEALTLVVLVLMAFLLGLR